MDDLHITSKEIEDFFATKSNKITTIGLSFFSLCYLYLLLKKGTTKEKVDTITVEGFGELQFTDNLEVIFKPMKYIKEILGGKLPEAEQVLYLLINTGGKSVGI